MFGRLSSDRRRVRRRPARSAKTPARNCVNSASRAARGDATTRMPRQARNSARRPVRNSGSPGADDRAYARSHESYRRPTEAGRIDGVSSQCRAVEASPSSRAHSMCADANRQSLTVLRLRDRPSAMHCCMAMLRRRRWLMRHLVVTMLRLRSRSRRLRNS